MRAIVACLVFPLVVQVATKELELIDRLVDKSLSHVQNVSFFHHTDLDGTMLAKSGMLGHFTVPRTASYAFIPAKMIKDIPLTRGAGRRCTYRHSALRCTPQREAFEEAIAAARRYGRLDLSGLGLTELPAEVFEISGMTELSVANNRLSSLPEKLGTLTSLKHLAVAGNMLTSLPDSLGNLASLEHLYAHGNCLTLLPPSLGQLTKLRTLGLSGNCLTSLPPEITDLHALVELSIAGNKLEKLPPMAAGMRSLEKLEAHGNNLRVLARDVCSLPALREVWVHGNDLETLPAELLRSATLQQLSAASNPRLAVFEDLGEGEPGPAQLESVWLYGTAIKRLPGALTRGWPLKELWLEGAPLEGEPLAQWIKALGQARKRSRPPKVGIDTEQASRAAETETAIRLGSAWPLPGVMVSRVAAGARGAALGYFKVDAAPGFATVAVVAFGSAPGTPNWGSTLGRARAELNNQNPGAATWDFIYVVDTRRDWYRDPSFCETLGAALEGYARVLMVGDSMGASGALLLSGHATRVLAFCPQVDLNASAIRPGDSTSGADFLAFRTRVLDAVRASHAHITIHTGQWVNDVAQAEMLKGRAEHVVCHCTGHRAARWLLENGVLLPLLCKAIAAEVEAATVKVDLKVR